MTGTQFEFDYKILHEKKVDPNFNNEPKFLTVRIMVNVEIDNFENEYQPEFRVIWDNTDVTQLIEYIYLDIYNEIESEVNERASTVASEFINEAV